MKINLYALYDTVAEEFSAPMGAVNHNSMFRMWHDLRESPQYAKHQTDYQVFFLGSMDTGSGQIELIQGPPQRLTETMLQNQGGDL